MAVMVRQLSFDFEKPQSVFSAMLPEGARVLGGDMFGRAPIMWVLADWEQPTEKFWFLYTICNTDIADVDDPTCLLQSKLEMEQLDYVDHFMQVDNGVYPPVIPWQVFHIRRKIRH